MNIKSIPTGLINQIKRTPALIREFAFLSKFVFILFLYSIHKFTAGMCCTRISRMLLKPLVRPLDTVILKIIGKIDKTNTAGITSTDLIELAFHELKAKKTRTLITIGGMSVGFGLIIFLLSVGYGLERLVISRVASLTEIKQAEVLVGQASNLAINDEVIGSIKELDSIDGVFPQINTVSKISFNNSIADAIAYGVTTRFLRDSAVQPTEGSIFENEEYAASPFQKNVPTAEGSQQNGAVAGISIVFDETIALGREIGKIRYSLFPLVWQAVYETPSTSSKILGYTQRQTGNQEATEVWGDWYAETQISQQASDDSGQRYSSWTKDTFPLWEKKTCEETQLDCVDGSYQVLRTNTSQLHQIGFITQESIQVERFDITIQRKNDLSLGSFVEDVSFELKSENWTKAYSSPQSGALLSSIATKQSSTNTEQSIKGSLVIGDSYYDTQGLGFIATDSSGKKVGYWVSAEVPTWTKVDCGEECDEYFLPTLDAEEVQQTQTVFLKASDVLLSQPPSQLAFPGKVLGEATESAELDAENALLEDEQETAVVTSTSSDILSELGDELGDDLDWALIASQAGLIRPKEAELLKTPASTKKVAIVNTAFLSLLGLDHSEAVGKTFDTKFIFDGKLFGNDDYRAESENIEYTIIGMLPDTKTPAYYVPFSDLQNFAVTRYSQLRIMVKDQNKLSQVRTEIEGMGFRTSSVVDTIERINTLFASIRIALLVLGMVALAVASLGMFNTLTVSLLEKTRQVGLMKAMGMKSHEVKRLFLAESVIMGVAGGIVGLLLAFLGGKLLSVGLSSLSIAKGVGVIDITHIPSTLAVLVVICAFFIGVLTGWYPSRRATKISALNALRYE